MHNNQDCDVQGQNLIEEDFYFANSDKLNYIIKEFKSETHTDKLCEAANPLVISKLDVKSVMNFNFPLIPKSDATRTIDIDKAVLTEAGYDLKAALRTVDGDDLICRRWIELAKNSVARLIVKRKDKFDESSDDE